MLVFDRSPILVYRALGEALVAALPSMSRDVVGVIVKYLLTGTASFGVCPQWLFSVGTAQHGPIKARGPVNPLIGAAPSGEILRAMSAGVCVVHGDRTSREDITKPLTEATRVGYRYQPGFGAMTFDHKVRPS